MSESLMSQVDSAGADVDALVNEERTLLSTLRGLQTRLAEHRRADSVSGAAADTTDAEAALEAAEAAARAADMEAAAASVQAEACMREASAMQEKQMALEESLEVSPTPSRLTRFDMCLRCRLLSHHHVWLSGHTRNASQV